MSSLAYKTRPMGVKHPMLGPGALPSVITGCSCPVSPSGLVVSAGHGSTTQRSWGLRPFCAEADRRGGGEGSAESLPRSNRPDFSKPKSGIITPRRKELFPEPHQSHAASFGRKPGFLAPSSKRLVCPRAPLFPAERTLRLLLPNTAVARAGLALRRGRLCRGARAAASPPSRRSSSRFSRQFSRRQKPRRIPAFKMEIIKRMVESSRCCGVSVPARRSRASLGFFSPLPPTKERLVCAGAAGMGRLLLGEPFSVRDGCSMGGML